MLWASCACSPSSSDEASASESGVERRTPGWLFSSLAVALGADPGGAFDCIAEVCLLDGAALTSDMNTGMISARPAKVKQR